MNPLYVIGGLSLAANLALTGLYLDKRDDLAREIERCNTDKMTSIAEAEKVTREATEAALAVRLAELESIAESEAKAREIAEDAAKIAESRPVKVRTVIKEVSSANACLNTPIPAVVIDSLWD